MCKNKKKSKLGDTKWTTKLQFPNTIFPKTSQSKEY